MESLPPVMMDRAINWAYLHETKDSFAIEREAPSEDKSRRFIQLLRQAHKRQPLDEEYLVTLQNATVSNPYDLARRPCWHCRCGCCSRPAYWPAAR